MNTLKAQWVVKAGVIPGIEIKEHTKVWQMTSQECEAENKSQLFTKYLMEANEYAMDLQTPQYLNWVTLEWIWF